MLDAMFSLAASENIECRFAYLPAPFLGLYDSRPDELPVILLHNDLKNNCRLLKCILAEELGHHFTAVGSTLAFARSTKAFSYIEQEQRAILWAVEYLVPLEKLAEAIDAGAFLPSELAEHLDVTERFMGTALKLYGAFYGYIFKTPPDIRPRPTKKPR